MIRAVLAAALIMALAPWIGPDISDDKLGFVFWQLRVPRVVVGVLVGAVLGLSGAVFQLLFANPLATPSTVGTTAGAALGALVALVLGKDASLGGPVLILAAFLGALVTSFLVASVAASGRAKMADVLLAGIATTLAASALSTGLQYTADRQALVSAVRWSFGHLPQVGYQGVWTLLPFVVISATTMLFQQRALLALTRGEAVAETQGVDVPWVRTISLGAGALGVAACVAWCGPIPFIGLIVPHLVRAWVGTSVGALLWGSMVVGAGLLVGCDGLARWILPARELPVGVLTAALGAPALVIIIRRQAR